MDRVARLTRQARLAQLGRLPTLARLARLATLSPDWPDWPEWPNTIKDRLHLNKQCKTNGIGTENLFEFLTFSIVYIFSRTPMAPWPLTE